MRGPGQDAEDIPGCGVGGEGLVAGAFLFCIFLIVLRRERPRDYRSPMISDLELSK